MGRQNEESVEKCKLTTSFFIFVLVVPVLLALGGLIFIVWKVMGPFFRV